MDSISTYTKRPYFLTWSGAWLIFLGSIVLLLSTLFLQEDRLRFSWTSLWGVILVTSGGFMYSASTFINGSILVSIAAGFLTKGLGMFAAVEAWNVNTVLSSSKNPQSKKSVVIVTAMILILIAVSLLITKGIQRLVKPYLGPANYTIYGSAVFGAGAFCYMILNIEYIHNVDEDAYHPLPATARFGGYCFTAGALVLLLAVSRQYYCLELLIMNNFPSMTIWKASPTQSFSLVLISACKFTAGVFLVTAQLLTSDGNQHRYVLATTSLLTFTYLLAMTCYMSFPKTTYAAIFSYLGYSVAWGLYALGEGMEIFSLQCIGMGIGSLSALLIMPTLVKYSTVQMLSPGNYLLLSHLLSLVGQVSLLLGQIPRSRWMGGHENQALISLGFMAVSLGGLLEALHSVILHDVCLIMSKENVSIGDMLCHILYNLYTCLGMRYSRLSNRRSAYSDGKHANLPALSIGSEDVIIEIDVLIVGCGPSGLTLANELGIRNTSTMIIDQRTQVTPDSRFFNLACSTVEGLKRLGLLRLIENKAIPGDFGHGSVAATGMTHSDMAVISEAHGPCRDKQKALGHSLSISEASRVFGSQNAEEPSFRIMQSYQEGCLREKLEDYKGVVETKYGWELVDFSIEKVEGREDRVIAQMRSVLSPGLSTYVRCQYLVGCDGPASLVARKVKARFDGFVNLGQTRTVHFKCPMLLEKVRGKLGEVLQYHVARPGYGVGWFVLNDMNQGLWTFFLVGLSDGRLPRDLNGEDMKGVVGEFLGDGVEFEIVSDTPWFWNLFFARQFVYHDRIILAGDAAHSLAPFGGLGGNCGYGDASNLGWKLAAVLKGQAKPSLIHTYNAERRNAGLRTIMTVLNFAPDRNQVLRMATIAQYKWLWWTVKYRWLFASTGAHAGNHMMSEGISYGLRYLSAITCQDTEHQGISPVESPPNLLLPALVVGGRLLHVKGREGNSLYSHIALEGYTLVIIKPTVHVVDPQHAHNLSAGDLESSPFSSLTKHPLVATLTASFALSNIPLHVVEIDPFLVDAKTITSQAKIVSMYEEWQVLLVRPDLYIAWGLKQDYPADGHISSRVIHDVVQRLAMLVVYDDQKEQETSLLHWLTTRFITNIQGYRTLHRQAIYFENEDKGEVLLMLSAKKKPNEEAQKKNGMDYQDLVTKANVHVAAMESDDV